MCLSLSRAPLGGSHYLAPEALGFLIVGKVINWLINLSLCPSWCWSVLLGSFLLLSSPLWNLMMPRNCLVLGHCKTTCQKMMFRVCWGCGCCLHVVTAARCICTIFQEGTPLISRSLDKMVWLSSQRAASWWCTTSMASSTDRTQADKLSYVVFNRCSKVLKLKRYSWWGRIMAGHSEYLSKYSLHLACKVVNSCLDCYSVAVHLFISVLS